MSTHREKTQAIRKYLRDNVKGILENIPEETKQQLLERAVVQFLMDTSVHLSDGKRMHGIMHKIQDLYRADMSYSTRRHPLDPRD